MTDVDQYTETQIQLDAKLRVINACASVVGSEIVADSADSTSSTLTNGAATTVQAILDLSDDAAAHVQAANGFLSSIGDLITANDNAAIAVND